MENSDQYDLKLVHLNVLYSNERYEGTLQKILDVSPDFISLQETNTDWFLFLKKKLAKDYPYNSLDVRYKPFSGLAVFSKYPIKNLKLWYVENLPVLSGFIEKDGTSVYFLSTHTHSPIRPWKFRSRNRHIEAVAGHLKGINSEKMILGDFNAVPWDSHILDFIKTASVVDSRDRHRPTFPSVLPLVKIPIDYVFHSPGMHCHDFKQLKQTYSDHYGIVCELSVEKQISCAER